MHEQLQKWMKAQGLTSPQVAKKMHYSRELVWRVSTGERPISDGFKWRFSETFGAQAASEVFGTTSQPEPV